VHAALPFTLKLRRPANSSKPSSKPSRHFLGSLPGPVYYDCGLPSPRANKATQIARLSRENAALKRELGRLQVYRAMAYRDPLTGLWNRRYFEERLNEELSRSQRAGLGRKFSVMVLDLNDFKTTNDRFGHVVGDGVLKDVGEFLVTHLRHHDVACRTGGDEFSVLLPDLSAEDCGHLISRLRTGLNTANAARRIPMSLSLGTASWPEAGDSAEALLTRADEAMYADKHRHRTRKIPAAGRQVARRTAARRSRAAANA
jgi:diguanylate cyclase (GGDEF)-like protein